MNTWMRCQLKRVVGLAAVLSVLLMTVFNFQGVVLCFENDGQVSLERSSMDGLCSDGLPFIDAEPSQHGGSSAKTTLQARHCNPCVDVPITIEHCERQNQRTQSFQGPREATLYPVSSFKGYVATLAVAQSDHLRHFSPGLHPRLRTIILLI